jgi:hypothetical protein
VSDFLKHWADYLSDLPLCFATVSGAHAYGFPSPDSDVDLRGAHQDRLEDVVGLRTPKQTWDRMGVHQGVEVDLVSHELGKYLQLLTKRNGYILEQVFSPLVVVGDEFLAELRPLAANCVTKHHYHHYRGFFATQRKKLDSEPVRKVKTLLYAYRVLLTGIHLMRTGEVEMDLRKLCDLESRGDLQELVEIKRRGERVEMPPGDSDAHDRQLAALEVELDESYAESTLPENPDKEAVHQFLVRRRLATRD